VTAKFVTQLVAPETARAEPRNWVSAPPTIFGGSAISVACLRMASWDVRIDVGHRRATAVPRVGTVL